MITDLLVAHEGAVCDHSSFLEGGLPALTSPERDAILTSVRALPRRTTPGCALDDPALVTWLEDTQGAPLAAPCVLHFETSARVFLREVTLGPHAIELDTGRLGIALPGRIRDRPPQGAACTVWLEGFWQTEGFLPGAHFVVTKVHPDLHPGAHVLSFRT